MSRNNSVYKIVLNRTLDLVRQKGLHAELPAETELAGLLKASRTTIRLVLDQLNQTGVLRWDGRQKTILRLPGQRDYFAAEETRSAGEKVETAFMEYILGGDLAPGAILHESDLAREFGVSSSAIREYLIRFSHFGLIGKEPNRHWVLNGFTRDFAVELFDMREMFEMRAFRSLVAAPPDAETIAELAVLEAEHRRVIARLDTEFLKFPRLDERFHHLLIRRLHNRFVDDFYQLISLIFHFHYRWNKDDEKARNHIAACEHLAVIHALQAADFPRAEAAFVSHLQSARRTLLGSVQWD